MAEGGVNVDDGTNFWDEFTTLPPVDKLAACLFVSLKLKLQENNLDKSQPPPNDTSQELKDGCMESYQDGETNALPRPDLRTLEERSNFDPAKFQMMLDNKEELIGMLDDFTSRFVSFKSKIARVEQLQEERTKARLVRTVERENSRRENAFTRSQVRRIEEKVDQCYTNQHENKLILYGVKENEETEDTKIVTENIFKIIFPWLPSDALESAHRIPLLPPLLQNAPNVDPGPRGIIACFKSLQTKQDILERKALFRDKTKYPVDEYPDYKNIFVDEDLPRKVRIRRATMRKVEDCLRENGSDVGTTRVKGDRLFLEGNIYKHHQLGDIPEKWKEVLLNSVPEVFELDHEDPLLGPGPFEEFVDRLHKGLDKPRS